MYGKLGLNVFLGCALLLLGTLAFAQTATKQINVQPRSDYWALLIGVSEFDDYEHFPKLPFDENDVRLIYATLTNPAAGGFFNPRQVYLLSNKEDVEKRPTAENIKRYVKDLAATANSGDTLFIYISAHGLYTEADGKNWLIASDSRFDEATGKPQNAVDVEADILSVLRTARASKRILVIDACNSAKPIGKGGAESDKLSLNPAFLNSAGLVTLSSSKYDEISLPFDTGNNSAYTHFFVEGLSGAGDSDRDGVVSLAELYEYVSRNLSAWAVGRSKKQTPVINGQMEGTIPIGFAAGGAGTTYTPPASGGVSGGDVSSGGGTATQSGAGNTGAVSATTGGIKISSNVADFEVLIDGVSYGVASGRQFTLGNLAPGKHTLTLRKSGYLDKVLEIDVPRGGFFDLSPALTEILGKLSVTCNVPGFEVWVDGTKRATASAGAASAEVSGLSPGAHKVEIKAGAGYSVASYDVTVTGVEAIPITAALDKVFGLFSIMVTPKEAHVEITGVKAFVGDVSAFDIAPGSYKVKVWLEGYETQEKTIEVGPRQPVNLLVELVKRTTPWPAVTTGTFATADWSKGARVAATCSGLSGSVYSVAFSPDRRYLATGSDDKTAKMWSVPDGTCITTFLGHFDSVCSVAFSPDGRYLATGSLDKTAKLWSVRDGQCIATLSGHSNSVYTVAFSPDGSTLVTGSFDKTTKLWSIPSGSCILTLSGHSDLVYSVAFSPDGRTLATGSYDKTAKLWSMPDGICIATLSASGVVMSVAISPDGRYLAAGCSDDTAKLWSVPDGRYIADLSGHGNNVPSVAFSPDGRTLAVGGNDPALWRVPEGTRIATLSGHSSAILSVAFSPDGRYLATGSYDKTAKLWEPAG